MMSLLFSHPEREGAPTEAPIEVTISIPDLVVTEELSTRSASPVQAGGLDTQLVSTTSSPESQSGAKLGTSKPRMVSPQMLWPTEK